MNKIITITNASTSPAAAYAAPTPGVECVSPAPAVTCAASTSSDRIRGIRVCSYLHGGGLLADERGATQCGRCRAAAALSGSGSRPAQGRYGQGRPGCRSPLARGGARSARSAERSRGLPVFVPAACVNAGGQPVWGELDGSPGRRPNNHAKRAERASTRDSFSAVTQTDNLACQKKKKSSSAAWVRQPGYCGCVTKQAHSRK